MTMDVVLQNVETTCGVRTLRTVRGQKLQQPTGKSCDTSRGS